MAVEYINGFASNGISYNNYNENKVPKTFDNRLENTLKYCREVGITYAEFQRREYFGLIPKSVLNRLHTNQEAKPITKKYSQLDHGIDRPSNHTKEDK